MPHSGAIPNEMGTVCERDMAQYSAAVQRFVAVIGYRHWGRSVLVRV